MAVTQAFFKDMVLDQYVNDEDEVIIMALNKHGSSTLAGLMHKHDKFVSARDLPGFYKSDRKGIFSSQEKYDQYQKYITVRDFDSVWVSAFCYETRTSHLRAILDHEGLYPEDPQAALFRIKEKLYGVINAVGGRKAFVSQDFPHMNGTYTAACYATQFPDEADYIVAECMPIPVEDLAPLVNEYGDVDLARHANKTPAIDKQAVREVFEGIGILEALREKYPEDYDFRELLLTEVWDK